MQHTLRRLGTTYLPLTTTWWGDTLSTWYGTTTHHYPHTTNYYDDYLLHTHGTSVFTTTFDFLTWTFTTSDTLRYVLGYVWDVWGNTTTALRRTTATYLDLDYLLTFYFTDPTDLGEPTPLPHTGFLLLLARVGTF